MMDGLRKFWATIVVFCVFYVVVSEATATNTEMANESTEFFGRMLEQGRTLVHNNIKRFMILLPVIFFKLGIAFTMLVLVTIVSVNNGFIGFLLLVVGLSSVLARLQETRRAPAVPYSVPIYQHRYAQDWDRKDRGTEEASTKSYGQGLGYSQQYVYPQLSTYNPSYFVQKA